jgi:phospholipid/cholesterol/gamma-HCH transport system permease protein
MTKPVQGTGTLNSPGQSTGVSKPKFGKGLRSAQGAATRPLQQAGEMFMMFIEVVGSAVTKPTGYWGDVREQMYEILKLCWLPMIISCTAFGFGAPGLQGGNIFLLFGIPERLGSFFLMARWSWPA